MTKPICGWCMGKGGWQERAEDDTLCGWQKCPKCKGTGEKVDALQAVLETCRMEGGK